MGIFSRKKKEVEVIEKTITEDLASIDMQVAGFANKVAESSNKEVQLIHLTSVVDKEGKEGNGKCFAVIGSSDNLIDMLEGAALKEVNFAKILVTVVERLVSNSKEFEKLQESIKNGSECMCESCQLERAASGAPGTLIPSMSIDDITKMSPEKMDELVKSIVKRTKRS